MRDDLVLGGTKARCIGALFGARAEYVYASPAYGYAQVALGYAARAAGKRATVFVAKRRERHARTREAEAAGARIVEVPFGYLSVVKAEARRYCAVSGAALLPWGLDSPAMIDALASVARSVSEQPDEVWSVAGSGVLSRALQLAWPRALLRGQRRRRPVRWSCDRVASAGAIRG